MPRATVTNELSEILRSMRQQNKIQAKNLAMHIGKSPAYISKLENGGIQSIDTGELYEILRYISQENRTSELVEQIYKTLTVKYSNKEIEEQIWFTNYDTVECRLPVPEALRVDLNNRISSLGISRNYLISRINANETLSCEVISDISIPYNQWFSTKRKGHNSQSIKISLSEKQLDDILDKIDYVESYVFVFSVLFYLIKIEKYQDTILLSDEQNGDLMKATTQILNSYKFLSIAEKNSLIAEKKNEKEVISLLSSFDEANIEIMNDILNGFNFATQHNIKSANEQLKNFSNNMHWDLGFMLKLISLEFNSLQDTSFSNKKNLLLEIQALITKYQNIPEEQNMIEEY